MNHRSITAQATGSVDQRVPILLYHSVSRHATDSFQKWTVSPDMLSQHLAYLRAQQFTPLTVSQLVDGMRQQPIRVPGRPVVVTFDDGFQDFYTEAMPILARHGFAATLFVTTGFVGDTSRWLANDGEGARPMLTWPQIREVTAAGVECGAHSRTHPQLDTLPREVAWEEIRGSRAVLEDRLGEPVRSFAYPHGYHDGTIRRMVSQAGYDSACAVKHAMSSLRDDPFALARIVVTSDIDVGRLGQLLAAQGLRVAPFRERLATKGWRWARRTTTLVKHLSTRAPLESASPTSAHSSLRLPAILAAGPARSRLAPFARRWRRWRVRAELARACDLVPALAPALQTTWAEASTWRVLETDWTETQLAVLGLGPDADNRLVIAKLARRPGAAASLRRQADVLEHLLRLPSAGSLQPLLPVPFVGGDIRGHTYLVERALPGRVMLAVMAQPAARGRACSAALEAIHLLHRETARQVTVDEARLGQWILQPLDTLRTSVGLDQPLARLRQELRRAVYGRRLRVSWIHGDFWPGNVLVSPEGTTLTGIVDWDLAAPDDLPMHDILNMLLSVQSWTEGRELGELVRAHLEDPAVGYGPDRGQASDLVCAWLGDDLSERTCLLLYWLRFVTTHLSNCPWRARDRRWIARNVGSVLGLV